MQMMRAIWIKVKLTMRCSVLRTVLKLRFSRVRKYFWLRVMVDIWPEILKRDSSRAEVCSGDVPCFAGRLTRASFSTWKGGCALAGSPLGRNACAGRSVQWN